MKVKAIIFKDEVVKAAKLIAELEKETFDPWAASKAREALDILTQENK